MLSIKEGQLSETAGLFRRYHVRLYNFFLRLTMDRAVSEDLTQNLFYRLIRYRQSWQPGNGSFQSWIFRMARNIYADHCKQTARNPGRPVAFAAEEEEMEDRRIGYTEEHYARLDLALAGLHPEQREVLILSRYQGLKYEEIARIKDISVSAIKVQVHRALKQLRSLYFGKEDNSGGLAR
jgi:RNA polymerase sigma factor (sigma-70 family)